MYYTPDRWVIAKITPKEGKTYYKVFGTWMGGYLSGDSWRINSAIVEMKRKGDYLDFYGESGSVYHCHKDCKGMSSYTAKVAEGVSFQLKEEGHHFDILSPDELETYIGDVA